MTVAPNQYATKVFADHPIAMWSLDEEAFYLSLINDNNRLLTTWTLTGCTASNSPTLPSTPSPFTDDIYSSVTKSTTATGTIEFESPALFALGDVDVTDLNFNVNFFLYQNPTFINWFKVGYRYNNAGGTPQEVISAAIPPPTSSSWVNFNNTYPVPTSWSGSLKIFVQVNFADSTAGDASSRTVIMHGLSVGQDSQTTCYESLGSVDVTIPSIGLTGMTGISADQYGALADNGYYLVRENKMLANNQAMPIIYGTNHSTQIIPSGVNLPSLIFPGKGLLHESGRNKTYTFEMWMKIDPETTAALRVLGPLDSDDGLFVKEGFITLSIGGEVGSHFVGEWFRPMLVHIVLKEKNAVLMINGEQVVNIPFDRKTITLPNTNDWWAVYSYPAVNFFAVDCIAIYPYIIPEAVAKRRFVYGQAAPSIQSIDNAYQGTPTTIEFATSEYNASMIYPDVARWDAGYFNNLNATRDYLSIPNYSLPVINIGGRDLQEWYLDNKTVNDSEYPDGTHPNFVTFRPNQVTRTNLIVNPDFEVDLTGWTDTAFVTTTVSTEQARIGTKSMKVQNTSGTGGNTYAEYQITNLVIGRTYTFSVYVRAAIGTVNSSLYFYLGSSPQSVGYTATSTGWTRYSITRTATDTLGRFICTVDGTANGTVVYFDSAMVEEATSALPYFSGSYADPALRPISYGWTGTAHASTSTLSYWNPDGINYQDPSYFNFPTLNVLNDQLAAVYGIFEIESSIASDRPLMSFVNVTNGDTFLIKINGSTVTYSLNGTTLHTDTITIGTENLVGLNLQTAGVMLGAAVSRFFSSPSSIQLYVGGDGITTFEGKIYAVGFCNQTNYDKVAVNFNANGIALKGNYQIMLDHFASYTLLPEYEYGNFFLDISVAAEWEEYFPLTYFASYVKDDNGNPYYDIDMLQVNIGYPTVASSVVWIYSELRDDPTVGTIYSALRDGPHATYFDLKKNNSTGSSVSTSGSSMQSYIAFQPLADGQNKPLSQISYIKTLDLTNVIYPEDEVAPYDTAFLFKDNVVVFPPKANFQDYSMVVYLQINQRAILKNPLKVRSLEISARNLNFNQPNSVGTRFGKKIYPAVNVLGNIDQKAKMPMTIYKKSTPYIYTTDKSGIRVAHESASSVQSTTEDFIFLPINESGAFDYEVAALQFMVKTDFLDDSTDIKFIEIKHKNGFLLYVLDKNGTSSTVTAYSRTSEGVLLNGGAYNTGSFSYVFDGGTPSSVFPDAPYVDINGGPEGTNTVETSYTATTGSSFYQNGRYVVTPMLNNNEWNVIGIVLPTKLDFSEYSEGGIRLFGGSTFNNISYYLAEGLGVKTTLSARTWQQVFDQDGAVPAGTTWNYWNGTTWQGVYLLSQTKSYISTPEDIFEAYTGTNAEIVDDGYSMWFNHRQAQIIADASWDSFTLKPA